MNTYKAHSIFDKSKPIVLEHWFIITLKTGKCVLEVRKQETFPTISEWELWTCLMFCKKLYIVAAKGLLSTDHFMGT